MFSHNHSADDKDNYDHEKDNDVFNLGHREMVGHVVREDDKDDNIDNTDNEKDNEMFK